jgi:hypothetical protein
MRGCVRLLAIGFACAAGPTLAQSPPPATPQQFPGIDVWRTLNPQPPSNVQNQPGYTSAPPSTTNQNAPTGHAVGNATVFPSVTGAAFYDDNVFAANRNRQGSWGYIVRPEIGFQLNNTGTASINGGAYVEQRWYDRFSSESQTNAAAAIGGTNNIDKDTQVVGRVQYIHAHEDRGSVESQFQQFTNPIEYNQFDAAGAINKRHDRWWMSLGAAATWLDYSNATLAGVTVLQNYRNGDIIRVPLRVGYVVAPLTSVFVEGSYNTRDFDVGLYSSHGSRLVAGMLFEPGPGARVKGEIFAGGMWQDYSGTAIGFRDVSSWTYGASLGFLLTPTLTATLEGRREAREASLSGGALVSTVGDGVSVIQTVAAGRLDYLIRSDVVVSGGASYLENEYLGAGNDHAWSPLVGIKWFVNQWLTLGADYRGVVYDTGVIGSAGYHRNVYLLSATARF